MMTAVTGHRCRMVRLVSIDTAAKNECFQFIHEWNELYWPLFSQPKLILIY